MFNKPGIDDLYRREILPRVRGEILRESDEQTWSAPTEVVHQLG